MKKLLVLLVVLGSLQNLAAQKFDTFGKKINAKNAQNVSVAKQVTATSPKTLKLEGEVESVCQAAGCWMKLKLENGETMRVSFKDYGFFVPKNIAGKKVIIEGTAKVTETSVDELKHYAEDAGKSKAEIDKITKPKTELTFVADGVLIPKN
jgi:Domain of unknown function (DUF4920)